MKFEIKAVTDSANLLESLKSFKQVDDKMTRIDIAAIKQLVRKNQVEAFHVPGSLMLANCLTKKGAATRDLLSALSAGKIPAHLKFW